jgi:hypothetical protein
VFMVSMNPRRFRGMSTMTSVVAVMRLRHSRTTIGEDSNWPLGLCTGSQRYWTEYSTIHVLRELVEQANFENALYGRTSALRVRSGRVDLKVS